MGPERAEVPELLVLGSSDEAASVIAAARVALRSDCGQTSADGDPVAVTMLDAPVDAATGDDIAFAFTPADGRPGGAVYQLLAVGNALLVTSSAGEYTAASTADGVAAHGERNIALVQQQLCVFLAEGCDPGDAPSSTAPASGTPLTTIPDDFPLAAGYPDGDDYVLFGPTHRRTGDHSVDGEINPCGTTIWPSGGLDTLDVVLQGPELLSWREIAVYASAQESQEVLAAAREALDGCDTYPGEGATSLVVLEGDTGYDDVTSGVYDSSGMPSGLIVQMMRVGSAVLVSSTSGEYTAGSLQGGADLLTEDSRSLAEQMCLFTEAGC